jgi:creatinine amidohydrolase
MHLPVGTDAKLVEEICLRAARLCDSDILVAPVIWTGFSPHHLRFGATISVKPETLLNILRELIATMRAWISAIVLVNGHGGNRGVLQSFALESDVRFVNYWDLAQTVATVLFPDDRGSIGHAGQAETSMMLALDPGSVGVPEQSFTACLPGETLELPELGTSGVVGNPHAASSAAGTAFLDAVTDGLAHWLSGTSTDAERTQPV